jgi:hypothetical protein
VQGGKLDLRRAVRGLDDAQVAAKPAIVINAIAIF